MLIDVVVKEKILKSVESKKGEIIELLQQLIRTPSIFGEEGEAQKIVEKKFHNLDLEMDVFEADIKEIKKHPEYSPVEISEEKGYKGRPNVIGNLKGSGGGKSLILYSHIDTVPPAQPFELWKHDPFEAIIENNQIHGLGASDDKGGITAMISAVDAILDAGIKLKGDLSLYSVIEEEVGGSGGWLACILRGYGQADGAIYVHPLEGGLKQVKIASGGVLGFKIKVIGKTAHGRRAHEGVNAIGKAMKIYQCLEELNAHRALTVRYPLYEAHDLQAGKLPRSVNLHVAMINGGNYLDRVPEECEIICRISYTVDEKKEEIKKIVEEYIAKIAEADIWMRNHPPTIEWVGFNVSPSKADSNHPIVQTVRKYVKEITGETAVIAGSQGQSDLRWPILYGNTTALTVGSNASGGHILNEWIDINDLEKLIKILALSIVDWCGYEK